MKIFTFRLLAALAVTILGTVQCSLSPLCGGGTETGNPDGMLACARAVFAEVDSADRWTLASYLPDGEQQLDPNCLLTQKPQAPLGKSAATTQDTLVIVRDSNIIIITVARYDTVTVIDTLYNNVVVVRNVSVYDTVFPASQSAENSMVIVERIVPDTIRKIDTVVKSNIQVVPQRDTTYYPLTDSATVFQIYNQPNITRRISIGMASWTVSPNIIAPVLKPASDIENNTCYSLSRTALVQGTNVSEKYSDADNDGYLFGPDISQLSGTQFADMKSIVSPGRAQFSGTYALGNGQKTAMSVLFDAGIDYQIATPVDNRILSLGRQKTVNGRISERVTYANQAVDTSSAEAAVLVVEKYPQSGAVEGQSVWFHFLRGQDNLDHRQNRLAAITKEIYYRSGGLWALKAQVEVSAPDIAPAPYLNGKVTAQMFYNNQGSGSFSGTVDKATGELYGVYTENGVDYRVKYHRAMDWLEWENALVVITGN